MGATVVRLTPGLMILLIEVSQVERVGVVGRIQSVRLVRADPVRR
jgi:hypothetical protein